MAPGVFYSAHFKHCWCWFQDNDIDELLQDFESKCNRQILHTVVFYWTSTSLTKDAQLASD